MRSAGKYSCDCGDLVVGLLLSLSLDLRDLEVDALERERFSLLQPVQCKRSTE